ncbi:helix-turn-helix domain-containing protein [Streptomyces sp. NPDC005132]|uniref:helix-turn-helix domain-containing protein n=1 Tax=Streptomyces sp. NPDC005132 TaxID=3154294 RepID=UPI0033B075B7
MPCPGGAYALGCRRAQGGGLTDAERAARERVRPQAVACFENGERNREIAVVVRVSEQSVERWLRQWLTWSCSRPVALGRAAFLAPCPPTA